MSAPIVDRKKWIVGWSILGLSAFVAVLLYVRDTREGMWGCLIPISFGLILLLESTQEVKLSKESTDEMRKKYSAASAELHRMVDTGLLILPEAATSHLTEVMEPRYDDWREMPPYLFWETEEHLMKKALDALMRVARADLKE